MHVRACIIGFFIVIISQVSCRNDSINVVVSTHVFSEIDLSKEKYVVYYNERDPATVSFKLSSDEQKKIRSAFEKIDSYFTLERYYIGDSCNRSSKAYTIINNISQSAQRRIFIDLGCTVFSSAIPRDKVEKIKEFIYLVHEIVKAKPGVNELPESDRILM